MNLLLIHQNFPGQFRYVAQYFSAQSGHRVVAIGRYSAPGMAGIELHRYRPHRVASSQTHPYQQPFESAVLHGQQVVRVIQKLKAEGFRPDVILGHPAWGETLYVKDVFSDVPLVHFCEFYYRTQGADAGFDPEFPASLDGNCRLNTCNALHLLNLQQCDWGISPTHWQRSVHPEPYLQHESEQKAAGLTQELLKAERRDRLTRLTSPVDGSVQQLAIHTNGGVVTEAQPLMVIVPKDQPVEVEAMLENKDIGFVRPGQEVEIKVETFTFTKYGVVHGRVISVSEDAIEDERRGLLYSMRIQLGQGHIRVGSADVPLTAGMAISVEVKTDKRKVIEYFLSSLKQYANEGLDEG